MQQSKASDEALSWLIRHYSGEMTAEERQAFDVWLRADEAHLDAYTEAEAIWNDASHLAQDPDTGCIHVASEEIGPLDSHNPLPVEIGFDTEVFEQASSKSASPDDAHEQFVPFRKRRFIHAGNVITLCLTIVVAFGWYWRSLADQVTGIKPQIYTLADGSRLYLDADTALDVDFSDSERRLTLYHGACWFTVTADSQRPFRVRSGKLTVTALGTEFLVDSHPQAPYVAVTEHAVEATDDEHTVRIEQGQSLYAKADTPVWRTEAVDRQRLEGFRNGRLIAENRPLREVVDALSRYRHGVIVISNDKLAAERINAVFDILHPDHALDALRQILPINIVHFSPLLTVISPA